jgi:hypothetical protein
MKKYRLGMHLVPFFKDKPLSNLSTFDLPTVQRISGHNTLQMVVKYSHQNGDHIQGAMNKLENRYKAAGKK